MNSNGLGGATWEFDCSRRLKVIISKRVEKQKSGWRIRLRNMEFLIFELFTDIAYQYLNKWPPLNHSIFKTFSIFNDLPLDQSFFTLIYKTNIVMFPVYTDFILETFCVFSIFLHFFTRGENNKSARTKNVIGKIIQSNASKIFINNTGKFNH